MYCALIFYPGESSYIGLWQPEKASEWTICDVPSGSGTAQAVFLALETLLHDQHLSLAAITHIGVMTGPASYTHLRIFVATANTLAWSLHRPLFAIQPHHKLPQDLPELLPLAKVNVPLEPVYPYQIER